MNSMCSPPWYVGSALPGTSEITRKEYRPSKDYRPRTVGGGTEAPHWTGTCFWLPCPFSCKEKDTGCRTTCALCEKTVR